MKNQKKGIIESRQIVLGVLALVVLFSMIATNMAILRPVLAKWAEGTKINYDDGVDSEDLKSMNADATSSVNGLIYAVNKLAYIDTHKLEATAENINKEFGDGNVKVILALKGLQPLSLGTMQPKKQLAQAVYDCALIFKDQANENSYCYNVDGTGLGDTSLTHADLVIGLNSIKKDCKDEECKALIDILLNKRGIKKTALRLLGLTYAAFGYLSNDIVVDWKDNTIINKNTNPDTTNVVICANNRGVNEVFITNNPQDCNVKINTLPSENVQINVNDFSLPQNIAEKSDNLFFSSVEDWLNAYGDPNYLLFYEKFPHDESQYWHANSYNIAFLTIFGTEAVFLGIDLLTFGGGKVLRPMVNPLKKTMLGRSVIAVKDGIKSAGAATLRGVGRGLSRLFSKPFEWIMRRGVMKKTISDFFDESMEKTLKGLIGDDQFGRQFLANSKTKIDDILSDIASDSTLVNSKGAITKKGRQEFFDRLQKQVFTESNPTYKELIDKKAYYLAEDARASLGRALTESEDKEIFERAAGVVREELGEKAAKEISEQVAEASLRIIPRGWVWLTKGARRGQNMLKITLAGDVTDEAREKALLKMMQNTDDAFSSMSRRELQAFMANNHKAVDMLFDKHTGGIIFGEVIDAGADEASQKAAKAAMQKRLDDIIMKQGIDNFGKSFKLSTTMQAAASRSYDIWPPLHQKRYLVAAFVTYAALRLESMAEKHYPIGTNAIGLKTPYMHTVVYDELTDMDTDTEIKDYFKNFGNEGTLGMLPDTNRYFLSLTKDKHTFGWLFDQDPQRFHLVSPCQADIRMKVTRCECKTNEDPELNLFWTGKPIIMQDGTSYPAVDHFDGKTEMVFSFVDEGNYVKQCYGAGTKIFVWDASTKPLCIQIDPVLKDVEEYNYCYHGKDATWESIKTAITITEIALPFVCTAVTVGVGAVPCFAGLGFVGGLAGETIKAYVDTGHQWPNHD